MNWIEIKKENKLFFENNPLAEIILANMFENRYHRNTFNPALAILKFIQKLIIGSLKYIIFPKNKKNHNIVITAYLDKANDWGIKYPIAKYLDEMGIRILFILSKECLYNHRKELSTLNNTTLISRKNFGSCKLNIKIFPIFIKSVKKSISIIKNYHLGSFLEYIITFLSLTFWADYVVNRWLKNVNGSLTLGERKFGILYQLYNIKHFVIQHGHMTPKSIQTWPNFTSANNYRSILFGKSYKNRFKSLYPRTKFVSLGNPYYDNIFVRKFSKKDNLIIFFTSAVSDFLEGKYKRYNKEWIVYNTIKEIVQLYQNVSDYEIVIKLHPHDSSDIFLEYGPPFGRDISILDGKIDSFEVLKKAKVAITWESTVSLEAVISNTLSIQLLKDKTIFQEQEFSLIVENLKEIEEILYDEPLMREKCKNQKKIIEAKYLSNLGKAKEAIGNFIIKRI